MFTGLSTEVIAKQKTYHIQTEDKGKETAEIETVIYCEGKVMVSSRISYAPLLKKGADEEKIYRLMQLYHKKIIEQLKGGVLNFDKTEIQLKPRKKADDNMDEMIISYMEKHLEIEKLKLKVDSALSLKKSSQVVIKVSARKNISSAPIEGAVVSFSIVRDVDSPPQEVFKGSTNSSGHLKAGFSIPDFSGKGALVIEARSFWGNDRVIENIKESDEA